MISTPSPPDPMQTANQQAQFNLEAAQNQQALNMVNQVTPFGSLEYAPTSGKPTGPGGLHGAYPGMCSAYTKLTPPLQKLFYADVANARQNAAIRHSNNRASNGAN
jgi:hypothetical protein